MTPRQAKESPGIPDRMPVARGRVLGRVDRIAWPLLLLGAVVGTVAFALGSDRPGHAAGSFLGAMALVLACLGTVTLNVRIANRISPQLALLAALFSYGLTVAVMSLALVVSDPDVVVGPAVLAGILVAVVGWLAGLIRASWVR